MVHSTPLSPTIIIQNCLNILQFINWSMGLHMLLNMALIVKLYP